MRSARGVAQAHARPAEDDSPRPTKSAPTADRVVVGRRTRQVDADQPPAGEERLLTGPEAGITRDTITVKLDWRGRSSPYDTAGTKRARIEEKLEKLSVADN